MSLQNPLSKPFTQSRSMHVAHWRDVWRQWQHVSLDMLSLRRIVIVVAVLLLVLVNGYVVFELRQEYQQQLVRSEQATVNNTDVLAETTRRVVQTSDLMLTVLAERHTTPASFVRGAPRVQGLLERNLGLTPFAQNIVLLNAQGDYVNDALGEVDTTQNMAHRDYFSVHQARRTNDSANNLYIAKPGQERADDDWTLTLSRGIYAETGQFLGVVATIVTENALKNFYGDLLTAWPGEISLWHREGQLIVREPNNAAVMGLDFRQIDPLFRDLLPRSSRGSGHYRDPVSEANTITGFQVLPFYPLIATSSLTLEQALEPWWQQVRGQAWVALVRSLVIIAGSWLLLVFVAKQQRSSSHLARAQGALDTTRQLQRLLLPSQAELAHVTRNYNLDIAGYMDPAEDVGGDYYDVLPYERGVRISIGDVTGHGLESGIVMLMTQTAVRTMLESDLHNPEQQLDILNRALYDNIERMGSDKSLTFAMCDYREGTLHISGQHESVLHVQANGEATYIDTLDLGFYLGLERDIGKFIGSHKLELAPGDGVVLYTDGITEALNDAGEEYGLQRLRTVTHQHWQHTASEIQHALVEDLRQHTGDTAMDDDVTLLVFKRVDA